MTQSNAVAAFPQRPAAEARGSAVPFRFAASKIPLLLVDAIINGKGPFPFVVDTGACTCLVDSSLAAEIGLAATGTDEHHGAGGPLQIDLGTASSISVGNTMVENIETGITDELRRISAAAGVPIRGAIGFNFLNHSCVTIDFGRKEIAFEGSPAVAVGVRLPFTLAGAKPLMIVETMVNGTGPYAFALDTGASATVISRELATAAGIPLQESAATLTGAGGSNLKIKVTELQSVSMGPAEVRQVATAVVDFLQPLSEHLGRNIDGIIGFNVLQQFIVTLDYPAKQVVLQPR